MTSPKPPRCQRRVEDGTFSGHVCNRPVKVGFDICGIHVGADKRSAKADAQREALYRVRLQREEAKAGWRAQVEESAERVQAFLEQRATLRGLDANDITGANDAWLTVTDLQRLIEAARRA